MANVPVLQVPKNAVRGFAALCLLFFASTVFSLAGEEGEDGVAGTTPRQEEILEELRRFRPHGAAAGGVWMLEVWDSDTGLEDIVTVPDSRENAARCFKYLGDVYPQERDALRDDEGGTESKGVAALLEAAEMGMCRFIPDYYPEFVAADTPQPDFLILRDYLKALLKRGELAERRGDAGEAGRCFRAAILCGRHLAGDKSSSLIYITGLIFKLRGAQAYAGFLYRNGRQELSGKVTEYIERISTLMRAYDWKANVALGEFEGFACLPATIMIAQEDHEVFWRKEAVVRLASLRYGIPDVGGGTIQRNPGFERAADDALSRAAAEDPDATVRKLAVWAVRNITPGNYQELKHIFP